VNGCTPVESTILITIKDNLKKWIIMPHYS
jgi:hypothetical protein